MPDIRQMTYVPRAPVHVQLEAMSFLDLRRLNAGQVQRGDFAVLAAVRGGSGEVWIDFARHSLAERSLVLIRPGVVHRWSQIDQLRGDLVLFVGGAPAAPLPELLPGADSADCWTASRADWPLLTAGIRHLRLELDQAENTGSAVPEVTRHLLSALLRRALGPGTGTPGTDNLFDAFRLAVEQHLHTVHEVEPYARLLGYAPRTLTRAAQRATGRTAKQYICGRLVLEARRLLVHERLSASTCGRRLGFSDPANFSAFYVRETGETPGRWLSRQTAGSAVPL